MIVLIECGIIQQEGFLINRLCYLCLRNKMCHLIKARTWPCHSIGKMQYNPLGNERFVPYFAESFEVMRGDPISFWA